MSTRFSAVLLAAGQSSRMGRDKALLETEGRMLWERQRDVLVEIGAFEIFLSARADQEWARRASGFKAVLHDANPGCGPLTGITAALERAATTHLVVLAIDLPRMTPHWFEMLFAQCGPRVGAVGRAAEFFEPLAAVYPREFLPLAWEAIAGARYSLQPLLTQAVSSGLMNTTAISEAEKPWLENWNDVAS
jgi:molybdenum cofactor guanylyltransferase